MNETNGTSEPIVEPLQPEPLRPLAFIERHGISPVLFGFISLFVIFISYQLVGGLVAILATGGLKALLNVGQYTQTINPTKTRFITGIGQILFMLVPTLFLVRLATKKPIDYLRLRLPKPQLFIFPIIGIFSLQQLLQFYMLTQEKIHLPEQIERFIKQFKELLEEMYKMLVVSNSLSELFIVILVVALIPAIVEEILFRGLVQRSFENGLTPTKGVILTGIIFGAYHLNPFAFIPLAILGIYLSFLAQRADSIWVSVVAHFLNNATASVAMYLHYDDDTIITGNPGTMSFSMLAITFVVFAMIFVGSTYYFIRMTEQKENIQLENILPLEHHEGN